MAEERVNDPDSKTILVDGEEIVISNLTEYLHYVIRDLMPDRIDGLKKSHRRLIYSMFKNNSTNDKFNKSSKVISDAFELHPHNTDAIYKVATRLAQHFNYNPPVLNMYGNVGTYYGDRAADSRYTELKLSAYGVDVFKGNIDLGSIKTIASEDLTDREIAYFVPAVPAALIMGATTIGYGYGTSTPDRNLGDICDLVVAYCRHMEKNPLKPFNIGSYADKLLPDYPIANIILNNNELLSAYKESNFEHPIIIEGSVTLEHNRIIIHALPKGVPFTVMDIIQTLIATKVEWAEQSIIDPVSDSNGVIVPLKRNANVFDIWDRLKAAVKFTLNTIPRYNYCDEDGYLCQYRPTELLNIWYRKRCDLIIASKRKQLRDLKRRLMITQAYLIICEHTDDAINILRTSTFETAITNLMARFTELSGAQADYLRRGSISLLTKDASESLIKERDMLVEKINSICASFNHIPNEIAETAMAIKKKYAVARRTKLPNYIGYVSIDHGCVQFESVDEIPDILTRFPKSQIAIHMYDGPNIIQVNKAGKHIKGNIPKYTTGDIYGLSFSGDNGYTINFNKDEGTACSLKGIYFGTREAGFTYTSAKSYAVMKSGAIEVINVPDVLPLRKTPCRGIFTDIIYVYPYTDDDHYVLAINDQTPNTIYLQKISKGRRIVVSPPIGNTEIIHHHTGINWYFTPSPKFLNRVSGRAFRIIDAGALLNGDNVVKLDISAMARKKNKYFEILV